HLAFSTGFVFFCPISTYQLRERQLFDPRVAIELLIHNTTFCRVPFKLRERQLFDVSECRISSTSYRSLAIAADTDGSCCVEVAPDMDGTG
ncbi:unnamed protein product, partial [Acanthoscelides obtectus]